VKKVFFASWRFNFSKPFIGKLNGPEWQASGRLTSTTQIAMLSQAQASFSLLDWEIA